MHEYQSSIRHSYTCSFLPGRISPVVPIECPLPDEGETVEGTEPGHEGRKTYSVQLLITAMQPWVLLSYPTCNGYECITDSNHNSFYITDNILCGGTSSAAFPSHMVCFPSRLPYVVETLEQIQ